MTDTGPDVAPGGTTAVIRVSESTANTARTPLKLTAVVPVKRLPASVTWAPGSPNAGVIAATTGGGTVWCALPAASEGDAETG